VTREELKDAFMRGFPVVHNGTTYTCVSAIIYRKNPNGPHLSICGELLDRNGNSVTIAPPERIEKAAEHG